MKPSPRAFASSCLNRYAVERTEIAALAHIVEVPGPLDEHAATVACAALRANRDTIGTLQKKIANFKRLSE